MLKTPAWVWIPLILVLVATAIVDHMTEWSIRFTFFYAVVISATTLLKSVRWGLVLVLACSAYYFYDRVIAGRAPDLTLWNTFMEFGSYLLAWVPLYVVSVFVERDISGEGQANH